MSNCANCGTIKNETTGVCPKCSVKKKWIWHRLGFVGSGIFIVIGLMVYIFRGQLTTQIVCGAEGCLTSPDGAQVFYQFLGVIGLSIVLMATGICLVTYGVIGLVISSIAAYKKRLSQGSPDESN
jgi:hypothetical protein